MTNAEGPTSFIIFRDSVQTAADVSSQLDGPMGGGEQWADYLRVREQSERAAAKSADSISARHAHQELAECYARQLHKMRGAP